MLNYSLSAQLKHITNRICNIRHLFPIKTLEICIPSKSHISYWYPLTIIRLLSFNYYNRLLSVERVFPLLYGSYGIGMFDSAKSDADHSRGSSIRRQGTGRRNHVCPKCGNGYSVVKSLRRHLRYECGLTPRFKCPYCGTRSKQRGHVSQHIRRKHSGQRVYIIDSPWW
jgi:predicted nucleic-acid-binding Zn-ribbon protein